MFKLVYYLLTLAFIGNQLARFSFGEIAITFLDVTVGIVSLSWFLYNMYSLKSIFWENTVGRAWVLFVVAACVSLTVNIGNLSTNSFLIASLYLFRWVSYSSIFFAIKHLSKMQKNQIPSWLYFVGGWMVVIGYIQYFFYSNLRNLFYLGWDEHMYRLFSTFLDPNFAAAFFVLFTIFLLGGIFREAKTIGSGTDLAKKILLLFSIGAALLTFSRSGLIMLIVSLILLFLLENRKKLILLVIISLGIFVLSISRFFYLENINLFRTASTNERIKSAQQATQIIVSNPIFGVGFNAYRYAQVSMGFRMEKPPIVSHADSGTDNSWLFILATTGIVGAVFFCNFIYRLFNSLIYKSNGKIPIFTVISLITFIGLGIDSIFINSLFYPPLMLWMWVILGLTDYK